MKRSLRKKLEARIQSSMNAMDAYDEERMQQVRERAFQEYGRQEATRSPAREETRRRKIKSLCRGAMAVCVLALALIVIPLLYTALMPVTVGNAHNFVYTVGIWLNDALHLGFEFEKPVLDNEALDAVKEAESVQFATVEEAAEVLGYPIYALGEELADCSLESIEVNHMVDHVFQVTLRYTVESTELSIIQRQLPDSGILSPLEDTTILQCAAGKLVVWSRGDKYRAALVKDGWLISITASDSLQNVYSIFSTLHPVS